MTCPDILMLTVDSLRADRMGFQGYGMNTTPVLDSMIKNSAWCENGFTFVGNTQPSFPSIFTSTRPLSYGGYDQGIVNRPNNLPEVLYKAGYKTIHLVTFPWLRSRYGYARGVEYTEHLYSIVGIVGGALLTIKTQIIAHNKGILSFDNIIESVSLVIRGCLEDLIDYCDERISKYAIDKKYFGYSSFVQEGYNYLEIQSLAANHLKEFDKSPHEYVRKHILSLSDISSTAWISSRVRFKRKPAKLASMGWDLMVKLCCCLNKKGKFALYNLRNKRFVDAADLTDRIISILNEPRSRPIFLWTHYMDAHVPYTSGRLPKWSGKTAQYIRKVGYTHNPVLSSLALPAPETDGQINEWSCFYDASVRYIDEQIGRILQAIDRTGRGRSTLVVVAGDHGEEFGEHGDFSHRFHFYEESIRVPLVFYHPDLKEQKIEALVDLRDIAPTILDIAGVLIPESYEGKPVTKIRQDERKHLILECFYKGSCLFACRPVYMGVRTKRHKYIWREWIDPFDTVSKERVELYDLKVDKEEKNNIYSLVHPLIPQFNELIAGRLREIPEFVANRDPKILIDLGINIHNDTNIVYGKK